MGTATVSKVSSPRTARLRPKYVVFAIIAAMMAYVLHHNESFLIHRADPFWQHISSFKWWLLPHGLAGACALFLAPMQFSDRLRKRYPKWHRVAGRIYVAGAFILAPLGVYIQYFEERIGAPRSITIAAIVDATLLISTTAIAFYFILRGKVQQHRQWMTRSYAVALVFFEVRVISGVLGMDDSLAAGEVIIWICLAFSLLIADVILQLQESWRGRSAAAARSAG